MFLANWIIFWLSWRQKRVHLSFTEAEYVGMMETACQIQWIWNLYEEIGFILGLLPLCIDNQGAIFLASNPAQEKHTKHVRMPEHYIHEAVESGEIQLFYVSTDQQFADIFMKNLDKTKFQDGRNALHLQRYSQPSWHEYRGGVLRIMVFILLNFYFIIMILDSSHDLLSCDSW